jgi:N-methylhydantoinase B/oxoprolinase/acetone carboxylase alpha subunit
VAISRSSATASKVGQPRVIRAVSRRVATLAVAASGGGGYGDARERDPELVLADVRDGLLTVAEAEQLYGVVVEPDSLTATRP